MKKKTRLRMKPTRRTPVCLFQRTKHGAGDKKGLLQRTKYSAARPIATRKHPEDEGAATEARSPACRCPRKCLAHRYRALALILILRPNARRPPSRSHSSSRGPNEQTAKLSLNPARRTIISRSRPKRVWQRVTEAALKREWVGSGNECASWPPFVNWNAGRPSPEIAPPGIVLKRVAKAGMKTHLASLRAQKGGGSTSRPKQKQDFDGSVACAGVDLKLAKKTTQHKTQLKLYVREVGREAVKTALPAPRPWRKGGGSGGGGGDGGGR
ncbi:hypothetical protein K438DRAFT_2110954 [Mycena galopus ATCC 62051]|nr:hypothetical protein K438DRAFT_2110954 [Mycena galopus ATCC 62051]